jgi:hypothetical protein
LIGLDGKELAMRFARGSAFQNLRLGSINFKSQDDDRMTICPSNSQDDDRMTMCL